MNRKSLLAVVGYGAMLEQVEHELGAVDARLRAADIDLWYVLHPLAGRMPGHIDWFLDRANIGQAACLSPLEANHRMKEFDLAWVIGADDIVNPIANSSEVSPLQGVQVVEVWRAKQLIALRQALFGYCQIPNALWHQAVVWENSVKEGLQHILQLPNPQIKLSDLVSCHQQNGR